MEEKLNKAIEVAKARIPALTVPSDMQKAAQAVLNLTQAKAHYKAIEKSTKGLDKELEFVLGRVRSNLGATEMQQVTQAAMHLMAAKSQHEAMVQPAKEPPKRGPGRPKKDKSEVRPDEQNENT